MSDLRARIGRAHALVSHHVQVLLRAGLIRRIRRGRWSLLQLDTSRVAALGDQIAALASDQLRTAPSLNDLERIQGRPVPVTARVSTTVVASLASSAPVRPLCSPEIAGAPSW